MGLFGAFGGITKAIVNTAVLPVEFAARAVTLSDPLESAEKRLQKVQRNLASVERNVEEALDDE